uniref:DUF5679 domain-containing protein n=1 Tax=viral metagenome TaxID=1070528 RepID=A0A6M3IUF0_9ZZZZ
MAKTYEGYCVKCKKKREMEKVKVVVSANGMNMAKGSCIKCGCKMCKIIGKAK